MRPIWFLLCLLAGCAGAPGASAPAACSMEKVAEVPLRVVDGHLAAPVTIERQPATMLVDTGSERTLVTPGAADAFGLQPDPHAQTRIIGTGGSVMAGHARLHSFGLGGMEMLDQSYAVESLPESGAIGEELSGLIGADWLSDYDVDLDAAHRRMALYRSEGCAGDHLPWAGAHATEPVRLYGRGLVLLKVMVDGVPVTALLDSGAQRSMISAEAAARAGVPEAATAHDPSGRSFGVDGRIAITRLHPFRSVAIGSERMSDMPLVVAPLQGPSGAEMLLGLDWLARNRVWIDYRARTIAIQPNG